MPNLPPTPNSNLISPPITPQQRHKIPLPTPIRIIQTRPIPTIPSTSSTRRPPPIPKRRILIKTQLSIPPLQNPAQAREIPGVDSSKHRLFEDGRLVREQEVDDGEEIAALARLARLRHDGDPGLGHDGGADGEEDGDDVGVGALHGGEETGVDHAALDV